MVSIADCCGRLCGVAMSIESCLLMPYNKFSYHDLSCLEYITTVVPLSRYNHNFYLSPGIEDPSSCSLFVVLSSERLLPTQNSWGGFTSVLNLVFSGVLSSEVFSTWRDGFCGYLKSPMCQVFL